MFETQRTATAAAPGSTGHDLAGHFAPEAVRCWMTRGGRPLDGMLILAWQWIHGAGGFPRLPSRISFQGAELGRFFGRASSATPCQWIATLEREGLLRVIEGRAGHGGRTLVELLDPTALSELRAASADPQRPLPFEGSDDTAGPDLLAFAPLAAEPAKPHSSSGCAEVCLPPNAAKPHSSACCAEVCTSDRDGAGRPADLLAAVAERVGKDRAELWLSGARLEVAADVLTLVFPSAALRDLAWRALGQDLRLAALALGFHDAAARVDTAAAGISKPHSSACCAEVPAQQPTLVNRTPTQGSINQPTNQPKILESRKEQDEASERHPLLADAAEIYTRIGDPTLWRWVAIATALLAAEGIISREIIDQLIESERADFGAAIKRAAGRHWPKQGPLKSKLAARGIRWRRSWERGAQPRST